MDQINLTQYTSDHHDKALDHMHHGHNQQHVAVTGTYAYIRSGTKYPQTLKGTQSIKPKTKTPSNSSDEIAYQYRRQMRVNQENKARGILGWMNPMR